MKKQTSKEKISNWISLIQSGEIKTNAVRIIDFIKRNPNTDIYEMRLTTGIRHQSLTAGLSEIMDTGIVRFNGEVTKVNGYTYSRLIYVEDEIEQRKGQVERKNEKFQMWIKYGIENFSEKFNLFLRAELNSALNEKM